jgi:hypothetical protein
MIKLLMLRATVEQRVPPGVGALELEEWKEDAR